MINTSQSKYFSVNIFARHQALSLLMNNLKSTFLFRMTENIKI